MVDFATPAAVAASDRLSMVFSLRLVLCPCKVAMRSVKLSICGSGDVFAEGRGAKLSAMSVSGGSARFSMTRPPRRCVGYSRNVLNTWLRDCYLERWLACSTAWTTSSQNILAAPNASSPLNVFRITLKATSARMPKASSGGMYQTISEICSFARATASIWWMSFAGSGLFGGGIGITSPTAMPLNCRVFDLYHDLRKMIRQAAEGHVHSLGGLSWLPNDHRPPPC